MGYNSKYKGAEVDALLEKAGTAIQEHQDISGKQDVISDLAAIREGASKGATALQAVPSEYVTETELANKGYATTLSVNTALGGKVDKVNGKGLSANDFTTALKTKLEGLNNYDDAAIQQAVAGLQTQLNTLVSGDVDSAIESFNEIIAFLDGVEDTETLDGIIASIEQQIAAKYTKPSTGIPKGDLAAAVQASLGKADTALQSHQSLDGYVKDTDLATVATSGNYTDLSNKPTIPTTLSGLTADASHRTVTDAEKSVWNAKSNFSGSYNDLTNKPTIPSAVTESTVSGWGFTKNTGTYSKPSGGIPKSDLASAVQTSLGKADTALQDAPSDGNNYVRKNAAWVTFNTTGGQVQANWGETNTSSAAYIQNKPTIGTLYERTGTTHGISSFVNQRLFTCKELCTSVSISKFATPNAGEIGWYSIVFFAQKDCTFSVPSRVTWANNVPITFSQIAYYEVSFLAMPIGSSMWDYLATWNVFDIVV